jgi:phage FluMu protein Com
VSGNNGSDSPDATDPGLEDQDIAGRVANAIPHLDGNAVAGPLWELFRFDIVAAIGRCRHCGAVRVFGETMVYVDAPGIVVRCASCEGVLLRLVETPTRYWLDVSGLSYLQIDREV